MSDIVSLVGLAGAAVCLFAYVWGCLLKPAGARWLSVMGLFATIVALAQLSYAMGAEGEGWRVNAAYAVAFMAIAGFAQSLSAVRSRGEAAAS